VAGPFVCTRPADHVLEEVVNLQGSPDSKPLEVFPWPMSSSPKCWRLQDKKTVQEFAPPIRQCPCPHLAHSCTFVTLDP
jgi:hypothetical protein